MNHATVLTRFAHAMLAFVLVVAMCVPMHAFADEPSEDAASSMAQSGDSSPGDASPDSSVPEGPDDDVQSDSDSAKAVDASSSQEPATVSSEPAPAAAGVVTMQQGTGKAKDYDSISAALADVADYDYKTNKEAYVITLNWHVDGPVTIPANKKVVIDLNGKQFKTTDDALVVESRLATLQDSQGGGRIESMYGTAVTIHADAKLAVLSGEITSHSASYGINNSGTLTMTGGSVYGIANNSSATISGGTVKGGVADIAIRNAGKLTLKGGSVSNGSTDPDSPAIMSHPSSSLIVSDGWISSPGTAVYARNLASLQISGGLISGDQCGVDVDGSTKVDISGGAFRSYSGFALSADGTVAATISGGEFTSASGKKAIDRKDTATVTLSGGTFNVVSAADVCDSPTFVDRYGAVERDGQVYVEMASPAAVVIAEDGTQTAYETLTKACSNAPAYSTVKLMEDAVLSKYAAKVQQFGVTVDLNGFSIDGTGYTGKDAALTLWAKYGAKPVEGKDSTLRLINSKPETGGTVTGKLPVAGQAGDSRFEVPVFIGEEVELAPVNGGVDKVELKSSAYLVYTEKTATFFSNGGFKVDAADGTQRVYGTYSSAAKYAAEGSTVAMLNDFTGNETIHSGDRVATLDLGGHTYTYTGSQQVLDVNYDDAGIVLKNGTVVATQPLSQAGVAMFCNNGTFTMDHVVMNIAGDSWGIGTNGTNVDNTIVLKDSTLNVPEGLGIYFPSTGSVTIDNSIINAKHFGVQVCAGDLTITGDKTAITATGAPQAKTDADGPIIDGAAVSVVEREGYKDLGAVAIEGGSFTAADSSKAVKTYTFNNADKVEGEWPGAGTVVAVSGGTFSDPVDEGICADDFAPQQNADGTFGVHVHQYTVAKSDADSHWTECAICGAVTDKQAHAFTVAEHDADAHWLKCEGCDVTTEKAPHSFEWVVDKEATGTEPGSKHEECTECGYAKGAVTIPATGTGAGDPGTTPGSGEDDAATGDESGGDKSAADDEDGEIALAKTADPLAYAVIGFGAIAVLAAALAFASRRAMAIRRMR